MQFVKIIALCVLAAIVYGIAHNQITARVCIEYFTVGHPPVLPTDDPTLLALGWGIIATWWVGLLLGVPLAIAARTGSRPKRSAASLIRPVAWLLAVMAVCALIAGGIGWLLAYNGAVILVGPISRRLPKELHTAFLVDLWAHSASYLVGFVGGIVLIVQVWRGRGRAATVANAAAENPAGGEVDAVRN